MESRPGPGRPVRIFGEDVGIAQGPDDVAWMIDWAALPEDTPVTLRAGGPGDWG
ncbi:hypothetical protein [Streptacidiphilus sp. EB129]|uniref:hypothetical protein n=1 Tax=Streptacidiphilus sp. EB129 TaxID=3156262 RepID=UPI003515C155